MKVQGLLLYVYAIINKKFHDVRKLSFQICHTLLHIILRTVFTHVRTVE